MIRQLVNIIKLALSPVEASRLALRRVRNVPERLLGRGSSTISSGEITTSRDMRLLKRKIFAHDFCPC